MIIKAQYIKLLKKCGVYCKTNDAASVLSVVIFDTVPIIIYNVLHYCTVYLSSGPFWVCSVSVIQYVMPVEF